MSNCPFLQYKDTSILGYEYLCKAQLNMKIGDNNNKYTTDNICKTSRHYDCPAYKATR